MNVPVASAGEVQVAVAGGINRNVGPATGEPGLQTQSRTRRSEGRGRLVPEVADPASRPAA